MKPPLTIQDLSTEALLFAQLETAFPEPSLYGVTDGKAVGTYLEHKFKAHLAAKYDFTLGNSAAGIDFPQLQVDMKVTSIAQPQSSCPFKSARQKIFGLGYSVLVFVYTKLDDPQLRTGTLNINHVVLVEKHRTADYQVTTGLQKLLANNANEDDLVAFMHERYLPMDDIEATKIAQELLAGAQLQTGYLTISNALQWRLQYGRVITQAGTVEGLQKIV